MFPPQVCGFLSPPADDSIVFVFCMCVWIKKECVCFDWCAWLPKCEICEIGTDFEMDDPLHVKIGVSLLLGRECVTWGSRAPSTEKATGKILGSMRCCFFYIRILLYSKNWQTDPLGLSTVVHSRSYDKLDETICKMRTIMGINIISHGRLASLTLSPISF